VLVSLIEFIAGVCRTFRGEFANPASQCAASGVKEARIAHQRCARKPPRSAVHRTAHRGPICHD
jgi:hypothetical protein